MTWTAFGNRSVLLPSFVDRNNGLGVRNLTIDAAADRVTCLGYWRHKSEEAQTVTGLGWLFGTVVKAAGSTFKATIQGVDLTAGPPARGDGVIAATVSVANADAGWVTGAWYEGLFDGGATLTLIPGQLVAVVLQFDSFVATDSAVIVGADRLNGSPYAGVNGVVANLTGSYAVQDQMPNVAFRCADGTYGYIQDAWVQSAQTTVTVNVNTAGADEYAMQVRVPCPWRVNTLLAFLSLSTAGDQTEICLYQETTTLATATLDHHAILTASSRLYTVSIPEQTLWPGTSYFVGVRPLGANNITLTTFTVPTVAHWDCHGGAADWHLWTRLNQGAWEGQVTTRRPFFGLGISAVQAREIHRLVS